MTQRFIGFAVYLVSLIAPSPAFAEPPAPNTSEVFTALAWVDASARNLWRGLDRGLGGGGVGAALSLGDPGKGMTRLIALADARSAVANRVSVSDQLRTSATVIRQVAEDGAWVWGSIDGYALPRAEHGVATAEVGAGLRFRWPWWWQERSPFVLAEVHKDLVRNGAVYARGSARFDYKVGARFSFVAEVGQAWSNLPSGEESGTFSFGNHGTDATVTFVVQNEAEVASTFGYSIEPYVKSVWVSRNRQSWLVDGGLRFSLVY